MSKVKQFLSNMFGDTTLQCLKPPIIADIEGSIDPTHTFEGLDWFITFRCVGPSTPVDIEGSGYSA